MSGIHDIALFIAAGLLLNLTPGPDMAYIAARSVAGGFRVDVALLVAHPEAVHPAERRGRHDGKALGERPARLVVVPEVRLVAPAPPLRIFREAFVINVFNPKVALFFLAFLPQFIAADAPAKALSFVLLGCLFNFNSLFVNLPVAWLASRAGRGLRGSARAARWLAGAVGGLFVLLAARLATLEK